MAHVSNEASAISRTKVGLGMSASRFRKKAKIVGAIISHFFPDCFRDQSTGLICRIGRRLESMPLNHLRDISPISVAQPGRVA